MINNNAAAISEAILKFLGECNLDLSNLRGQGYDGASVMEARLLRSQLESLRNRKKLYISTAEHIV